MVIFNCNNVSQYYYSFILLLKQCNLGETKPKLFNCIIVIIITMLQEPFIYN